MKKFLLSSIILLFGLGASSQELKTFHDFKVVAIDGTEYDLAQLKGKKVLVVNTASKCGFTKQYEDLELLYDTYKKQNFVIIGFPANNFNNQEPGTNQEIAEFCKKNYGVSFPMMEKISVKGEDMHPLYLWLTSKDQNGVMDSHVKWNFQKYLIDENGSLVDVIYSATKPDAAIITDWIEGKK